MAEHTISLVIPAYNEQERIVPFLHSIEEYARVHAGQISEVIVVDDGSRDATARVAEDIGKNIDGFSLIRLGVNQGKGGAVQAGVMVATGDYIVFMDADGATAIDELPKMIAALKGHDIAIGSRWLQGAHTQRSSAFRALSGYLNRSYMKLFGFGNIDTMCGFKGYRNKIAKALYQDLQEKRWLFDTEIAYRAICRNYAITNFPIAWESKDGSKLDTFTLLKSALAIFPLIMRIRKDEQSKTRTA